MSNPKSKSHKNKKASDLYESSKRDKNSGQITGKFSEISLVWQSDYEYIHFCCADIITISKPLLLLWKVTECNRGSRRYQLQLINNNSNHFDRVATSVSLRWKHNLVTVSLSLLSLSLSAGIQSKFFTLANSHSPWADNRYENVRLSNRMCCWAFTSGLLQALFFRRSTISRLLNLRCIILSCYL